MAHSVHSNTTTQRQWLHWHHTEIGVITGFRKTNAELSACPKIGFPTKGTYTSIYIQKNQIHISNSRPNRPFATTFDSYTSKKKKTNKSDSIRDRRIWRHRWSQSWMNGANWMAPSLAHGDVLRKRSHTIEPCALCWEYDSIDLATVLRFRRQLNCGTKPHIVGLYTYYSCAHCPRRPLLSTARFCSCDVPKTPTHNPLIIISSQIVSIWPWILYTIRHPIHRSTATHTYLKAGRAISTRHRWAFDKRWTRRNPKTLSTNRFAAIHAKLKVSTTKHVHSYMSFWPCVRHTPWPKSNFNIGQPHHDWKCKQQKIRNLRKRIYSERAKMTRKCWSKIHPLIMK